MRKMEKIFVSLLCLFLLSGCTSLSNRVDSVTEVTLSAKEIDYYRNEEIEINMNTNCQYQIQATDFVMFGGLVEIKDLHTAIVSFPSAGTFHVYVEVNGIRSNELSLKVVSSNATANRVEQGEESDKPKKEIVRNPPEIPYTEKDFNDVNTLFYADASELADSTKVAEHIKDYVGYMFAMEGYMSEDGDKKYLLSPSGRHIPLINGSDVQLIGNVRVFGLMEDNGFHVKVYAFGPNGAYSTYVPQESYDEEEYDDSSDEEYEEEEYYDEEEYE